MADVEALVVFTPFLAGDEPRLMGEVARWVRGHRNRLSAPKMRVYLRDVPGAVETTAKAFLEGMEDGELGVPELPLYRPALLPLRAAAVVGSGVKADLLTLLLASQSFVGASKAVARLGYSRKSVSALLTEWVDAGVVELRGTARRRNVRLANRESWSAILDVEEVVYFGTKTALTVFVAAKMLDELTVSGPAAELTAVDLVEYLRPAAERLESLMLPEVAGNPNLVSELSEWLDETTRVIALGPYKPAEGWSPFE